MIRWKKPLVFVVLAAMLTALALGINHLDQRHKNAEHFQEQFLKSESRLAQFLSVEAVKFRLGGVIHISHPDFIVHSYTEDTLNYWSNNSMPISKHSDLLFPSNGLIHLQNGWYFSKTKHIGKTILCASFLIKHDYPYENGDLSNRFSSIFGSSANDFQISLEEGQGVKIRNGKGSYLFSLINAPDIENPLTSQLVLFLCMLIIGLWCYSFWLIFIELSGSLRWIVPFAVFFARLLLHIVGPIEFNVGKGATDPSLYASNQWFPNFFEFLLNCALILLLSAIVHRFIRQYSQKRWHSLVFVFLSVLYWLVPRDLCESLVENSSIPFSIDKLFSLNGYTILAVSSIAGLIYMQYKLFQASFKSCLRTGISKASIRFVVVISEAILVFWIGFIEQQTVIPELFLLGYLVIVTLNWKKERTMGTNILRFSTGTLMLTVLFHFFFLEKIKIEQQLYAQKLASEDTILTELEFAKISERIQFDPILTRLQPSDALSVSEFKNGLERRIFNGFWERYDIDFFLFDSLGSSVLKKSKEPDTAQFEKLNELIEKHGDRSKIDPAIFFIRDLTDQISFVIKLSYQAREQENRSFFAVLRSKKIPEEIGFPRLLISEKANALQQLEKFSIAKYHKKRLVANYGAFIYPFNAEILQNWEKDEGEFRRNGGFRHYLVPSQGNDLIVLSMPKSGLFSVINGFMYLFLFYGLIFLTSRFRIKALINRSLTLAMRIQIILLLIVFVSLLAFGWGSSAFIRSQYETFSNNMITDKLSSMHLEVDEKIHNLQELTIEDTGSSLETTLIKLGRIYHADLNLYDRHGFLIASSRPMIYKLGLTGELMNRKAMNAFAFQNNSRFIQQEKIGELNFASAYLPCFNKRGSTLGYLNLQYFGKQKELEEQIESFLVSIVNIFMLLLVLSLISALFISNWLTAPLRKLKDNLNHIKLGRTNNPIIYHQSDEIGALVNAYNSKLQELELTVLELAKSERESAWREMAKQVAHEIKNPLTPMKLSIQQLERSFDPNDPNSSQKLSKVSRSLIEQIDALSNIANEFSNFANMPVPNEQDIDLIQLIDNVLSVFRGTSECLFTFSHEEPTLMIRADKDQMIRVFNNIIQNALHALSAERPGEVSVEITQSLHDIVIEITDNGNGIPENVQKMMFTPHFTTKSAGSGLGLAMVKQIIKNHKGEISFRSTLGSGTTFRIVFPKN